MLGSFDLESYDICEPCLHGKMTKSPFNKKGERASDLLGFIHTVVCGPLSTQARGGLATSWRSRMTSVDMTMFI